MNGKEHFREKEMLKNTTAAMCFKSFSHFVLQVTLKYIWCAFKIKITKISLYENVRWKEPCGWAIKSGEMDCKVETVKSISLG